MLTDSAPQEAPKPRSRAAGKANRERFAELRAQGMTPREIGRETNFLEAHVRRQLRRYDAEQEAEKPAGRKTA